MNIVASFLVNSGITALALTLFYFMFKSALESAIEKQFEKDLEKYKKELELRDLQRRKAAEVAELISLWLKANYFPEENVNHLRYELQRKYWELVLWIDEPIIEQLHEVFSTANMANSNGPGITHKQGIMRPKFWTTC